MKTVVVFGYDSDMGRGEGGQAVNDPRCNETLVSQKNEKNLAAL